MTALLLLLGAVLLVSGGLALIVFGAALRAWWYRLFQDPDGKSSTEKRPPDLVQRAYEEAGDTFGFQRATPWIDGNHPLDCAKRCCWEIRLDEMHDAFDWGAYEHEMRSKR